jgi:hypothetical protein
MVWPFQQKEPSLRTQLLALLQDETAREYALDDFFSYVGMRLNRISEDQYTLRFINGEHAHREDKVKLLEMFKEELEKNIDEELIDGFIYYSVMRLIAPEEKFAVTISPSSDE